MIRGGYVRQFLKGFPANSYKQSFAEIVVAVDYEGVTWDLLTCIELSEIHQPDGYSCELCDPANRMLYPTRTALLEAELFEPLATWVNEKLSPACWLLLKKTDGCTWVELAGAIPPESVFEENCIVQCIPIHERNV